MFFLRLWMREVLRRRCVEKGVARAKNVGDFDVRHCCGLVLVVVVLVVSVSVVSAVRKRMAFSLEMGFAWAWRTAHDEKKKTRRRKTLVNFKARRCYCTI